MVMPVSTTSWSIGSTMPKRAMKLSSRFTTTSMATPISSSGSTSKILLSTEYTVPSTALRRYARA